MNIKKIKKLNNETNTVESKFEKGYKFIKRETMTQRDEYYESVVNWNKGEIKRQIAESQLKLKNLPEDVLPWKKSQVEDRVTYLVKREENTNYNVMTLRWLKDAEDYFDNKLKNVSDKLVKFGFCELRADMEVVDVSENHSRGLDFYIKCTEYTYSETEERFGNPKKIYEDKGRAHARLVWVNCYDKASHWRFICTLKKTK